MRNSLFKRNKLSAALGMALATMYCSPSVLAAQQKDDGAVKEEIVVTGIRGSILRANDIKSKSGQVVEALTLENLGEFSDESLADALQRVPGLQIERDESGTGGNRLSIRGIGPQFVVTSINGRIPFSSGSEGANDLRSFNVNVIPTEILGGALVYKTPAAENIESGLAGTVDLQTLKPLDISKLRDKNFFVAGKVQTRYDEVGEEQSPRINAIVGSKNEEGTLGGYLAFVSGTDERLREQVRHNNHQLRTFRIDNNGDGAFSEADGDTLLEGVRAPNVVIQNPIETETERFGVAGAIQWRPNDNWDVTLDYFNSEFDDISTRNSSRIFLGNSLFRNNRLFDPGSLTIVDDYVVAGSGSDVAEAVAGGQLPQMQFASQIFDNTTENEMVGLNVKWSNGDDLFVDFDFAHSTMDYFQKLASPIVVRARATDLSTVSYDALGDAQFFSVGDNFDIVDIAANNPGGIIQRRNVNNERMSYAENDSIALDVEKVLNDTWTVKAGVRYEDALVDVRSATLDPSLRPVPSGETADTINTLLASSGTTNPFLEGVFPDSSHNQWIDFDFDAVRALNLPGGPQLTAVGTGIFSGNLLDASQIEDSDFLLNLGSSFTVEEETLSLYTQFDFDTEIGQKKVSGNFGVRAIRVSTNSLGFGQTSVVDPDQTLDDLVDADGDGDFNDVPDLIRLTNAPTVVDDEYWEVLPAVNVAIELTDAVKLRLAASRVISRPDYNAIRPSNSLTVANLTAIADDPAYVNVEPSDLEGSGNGGNINLKPYSANQFDATVEWATENNGYVFFSAFYKDVSDYILIQEVAPDSIAPPLDADGFFSSQGVDIVDVFANTQFDGVTQPINFSDAEVKGFEIGADQELTFLPWEGFGVRANYTYVDSEFDQEIIEGETFGFEGSSKNNANIVLYYQQGDWQTRLAAAWRDDYLRNFGSGGSTGQRQNVQFNEGVTNLSWSLSYKITENLKINFNATNLLDEDVRTFLADNTQLPDVYINRGRSYAASLSFNF